MSGVTIKVTSGAPGVSSQADDDSDQGDYGELDPEDYGELDPKYYGELDQDDYRVSDQEDHTPPNNSSDFPSPHSLHISVCDPRVFDSSAFELPLRYSVRIAGDGTDPDGHTYLSTFGYVPNKSDSPPTIADHSTTVPPPTLVAPPTTNNSQLPWTAEIEEKATRELRHFEADIRNIRVFASATVIFPPGKEPPDSITASFPELSSEAKDAEIFTRFCLRHADESEPINKEHAHDPDSYNTWDHPWVGTFRLPPPLPNREANATDQQDDSTAVTVARESIRIQIPLMEQKHSDAVNSGDSTNDRVNPIPYYDYSQEGHEFLPSQKQSLTAGNDTFKGLVHGGISYLLVNKGPFLGTSTPSGFFVPING
ncbi:hypothetical protein BCR39DRAFT_557371 [Naematelia encephala]|uniref:Uncharacterized protein n=1 Tax=Naematelia encephala TaxID=71784 RepID=A0A1Y2BD92_9TREE|nr:hypothetical protein BCR39DRAFT_557371 [Naematelia encephala]